MCVSPLEKKARRNSASSLNPIASLLTLFLPFLLLRALSLDRQKRETAYKDDAIGLGFGVLFRRAFFSKGFAHIPAYIWKSNSLTHPNGVFTKCSRSIPRSILNCPLLAVLFICRGFCLVESKIDVSHSLWIFIAIFNYTIDSLVLSFTWSSKIKFSCIFYGIVSQTRCSQWQAPRDLNFLDFFIQ